MRTLYELSDGELAATIKRLVSDLNAACKAAAGRQITVKFTIDGTQSDVYHKLNASITKTY